MQVKTEAPEQKEEKKAATVLDYCLELQQARPQMVAEYKKLVHYTGNLVSTSMAYAYAKGISDATKFIFNKGKENAETTEKA